MTRRFTAFALTFLVGCALATQAWVTPQAGAGPWVTNPVLVRPRP